MIEVNSLLLSMLYRVLQNSCNRAKQTQQWLQYMEVNCWLLLLYMFRYLIDLEPKRASAYSQLRLGYCDHSWIFMSLILSAFSLLQVLRSLLYLYCMIINSIAIVLCKNAMIMKMHEWEKWASKPQVYRLFFASIYKSSNYFQQALLVSICS